ncbi:MAG: choice-of-anchor tandem repeat GloVer-containing protein [Methylocella sp.]
MRCKHILSLHTSRSALIGLLTGSAALAVASLAHVRPAAAAATETVLHKFNGGTDGANPHAGVISDSNGVLYGTTWRGGGTGCVAGLGCGTVFKLTPPAAGQTKWTKEILYRFQGGNDGEAPFAGLILDSKGALYGTTLAGGASFGLGTVFKLKPPAAGQTQWTEKVLYRFGGVGGDGVGPEAGLIFDSKGALYGTTSGGGGSSNCGTVFKLKPPVAGETQWTEKVLYSFAGTGDGCLPVYGRLIFDSEGALYGTTQGTTRVIGAAPSGVVFKLAPPASGHMWTETVLYSFKGGSDGSRPLAGVIFDSKGALYGTTLEGGGGASCGNGCGTVFKLKPPAAGLTQWTEKVLYRFQGTFAGDGEAPQGGLVFDPTGVLFGTTSAGGNISLGTVFKLKPPAAGLTQWTEKVLSDLPNGGASPIGEGLLCPVIGDQPACAPPGGRPVSGAGDELNCAEVFSALSSASGGSLFGDLIILFFIGKACG